MLPTHVGDASGYPRVPSQTQILIDRPRRAEAALNAVLYCANHDESMTHDDMTAILGDALVRIHVEQNICIAWLWAFWGSIPKFSPRPEAMRTFSLYVATAIAEIIGCYLPYLWLKEGKSVALLIPAALSLAIFAWLLTLHPSAAGRVYAAYGGVYISVALIWLWLVEGMRPTAWDLAGVAFSLFGMAIIAFQPR